MFGSMVGDVMVQVRFMCLLNSSDLVGVMCVQGLVILCSVHVEEVDQFIGWLIGYDVVGLLCQIECGVDFCIFFDEVSVLNLNCLFI